MTAPKATALPISVEVVDSDIPQKSLVLVNEQTALHIANLKAESAIVIIDADTANAAAAVLRDATKLGKDIDGMRLKLKRPFMDIEARIDSAAKAPIADLKAITDGLRPKLAKWQEHCERMAREAEAKRQEQIRLAEVERQRAEAAAAKAEADRLAAIAAAQVKPATDVVDEFADFDIIAAEVEAEHTQVNVAQVAAASAALQQTRAVIAPKPAGISYRKTLKFVVNDVHRLPSHLVTVTANDAAIRDQFVTGWKDGDPVPSHPGITFNVETTPVVSSARR